MTKIRCYMLKCQSNGKEKSNCGYCRKKSIVVGSEKRPCLDYIESGSDGK